jgi:hypothetical protein
MLTDQLQENAPYKCGVCGFVYQELEKAQECELRCITRAIKVLDRRLYQIKKQYM